MNLFIAPHPDDEILFGAYILQRKSCHVVICTDGTSHAKKFGIPIEKRREESQKAANIIQNNPFSDGNVTFLGIPEEKLTLSVLQEKIWVTFNPKKIEMLFLPTKTGGNPHHDTVSDLNNGLIASLNHIPALYYGTYSKIDLKPTGEMAIIPTEEEISKKTEALACFISQHGINGHHFKAVEGGVSEYLSFRQC